MKTTKENKLQCPKCRLDISTMKHLHKEHKYNWTCNCGKNVTKLKLKQLIKYVKKETGLKDKDVLPFLPLL